MDEDEVDINDLKNPHIVGNGTHLFEFKLPNGEKIPVLADTYEQAEQVMAGLNNPTARGSVFDDPRVRAPGKIAGAIDMLAQGATFGTADEIEATLRTGRLPFLPSKDESKEEAYQQVLTELRNKREDFRAVNPMLSFGMEMVGGGLQGYGLLKGASAVAPNAMRSFGRQRTGLQLAELGALEGGLYGAGAAEPGQRLEGAAMGAGAGAVGGPLLGAVAGAGGAGVRNTYDAIRQRLLGTTLDDAKITISRLLEMDQISADDAVRLLREMQETNPNARLFDIEPGGNLRAMGRRVVRDPGEGRNSMNAFLRSRDRSANRRVAGEIDRILRDEGVSGKSLKDIMDNAKQQAGPLYEQAYTIGVSVPRELTRLLESPRLSRFARKAAERVQSEARLRVFTGQPAGGHVEYLDYVLRDIQQEIGQAAKLGKTETVYELARYKQAIESVVYPQNPAFQQARKVYSDEMTLADAYELGNGLFKGQGKDPELVRMAIDGYTDADMASFRFGALKGLQDVVQVVKKNSGTGIGKLGPEASARVEDLLREVFTDQRNLQEFMDSMGVEAAMRQSSGFMQGGMAPTGHSGDPSMLARLTNRLDPFMSGDNWRRRIYRFFRNKINDEIDERTLSAIADILLDPNVLPRDLRPPAQIPTMRPQNFSGGVAGASVALPQAASQAVSGLQGVQSLGLLSNFDGQADN